MEDAPAQVERVQALISRYNEPVIPIERVEKWLAQFPEEDREGALALLEQVTFHTYPGLVRETRALHAALKERLAADGFDCTGTSNIDFSRGFTCKSGDIISYIYRKANAIPSIAFKNFDRLSRDRLQSTGEFCDRALVILDDYIGTGSQFIFQLLARNPDDMLVIRGYRKVCLAAIVIHENAFEKLAMLRRGEYQRVLATEEGQFLDYDWSCEEQALYAALASMDWSRLDFVCVERENPLLSKENTVGDNRTREIIAQFLAKYGDDSTLTTSYLSGHHTFFYGAPNSLPKILFPLFSRVEDFSIYPMENFLIDSPDVTCWDIDGR